MPETSVERPTEPSLDPPAGTPTPTPVLQIKDLSYRYTEHGPPVLSAVDLEVLPGEVVAIVGPSGSGKSTLLQLAGAMLPLQEGAIRLAGTEIGDLSRTRRAALRASTLGFVFQSFNLLPGLTALENVEVPMLLTDASSRQSRDTAKALLEQVGLAERANHRANTLSGGEMQRTAIARAVANNPKLLLADEPTGNLDATTTTAVLDVLLETVLDDRAILVVTHDPRIAAAAHRVVELDHTGSTQAGSAA